MKKVFGFLLTIFVFVSLCFAAPTKPQTKGKAGAAKVSAKAQAKKTTAKTPVKAAAKTAVKASPAFGGKTSSAARNNANNKTIKKRVVDDDDEEDDEDEPVAKPKRKAIVSNEGPGSNTGNSVGSNAIYKLSIYKLGTRIKLMEAPVIGVGPDLAACAFDAVAELMDSGKDLQPVIETSTGFVNALLTEVDVLNNLALLKVSSAKLPNYISLNSVRKGYPQPGEPLAVFGYMRNSPLVKWTTQAVGNVTDGLITGFRTQLPTEGVSVGALIFDADKKWVGIASRGDRSPTVQGFLASAAVDLIGKVRQPASIPSYRAQAVNQYSKIQGYWMGALYSPDSSLPIKTKNWSLGVTSKNFDCQVESISLNDTSVASAIYKADVQRCQNPITIGGAAWMPAGIEIVSGTVQLKNGTANDDTREKFELDLTQSWKKRFETQVMDVSTFSSKDCQQTKVKNSRGQPISVEFCTSAHRSAIGLNDWFIRLNTWSDQGEGAFIVSRLRGFQLETAQKLIAKLTDELRRDP